MGPERAEKPNIQLFKITHNLPTSQETPRTENVEVEISPDGGTYTAEFTIDGHKFTGTASKAAGEEPADAVAKALNAVSPDDKADQWFLTA